MSQVATYVFIDLETTGLPKEELNKTRITELSMIAVKRDHILDTRPGNVPRVQHKLTLCFNPRRLICHDGSKVTGLDNDLLEHEPEFNLDIFNLINGFLVVLSKPVCLIAHNGSRFDFPILKNHFEKLKVSLTDDLLCADCYDGFYYILEKIKLKIKENFEAKPSLRPDELKAEDSAQTPKEIDHFNSNNLAMKVINETTPKQNKIPVPRHGNSKARRRLPWGDGPKPTDSYKLKNIYERVLNRQAVDAHRAENDCTFALEISAALSKDFVEWVDENNVKFSDIVPMRLGLLALTGMLWGCTNPFIRQGTRGLRDVTANSWLGQAKAEVMFLLGNWRYVLPWLVNQSGSIAYLLAVQRAPLSVAVPVANGLAFVCTALTGALTGVDEPLHRGSIMGIALIIAGTALCCLDKTS